MGDQLISGAQQILMVLGAQGAREPRTMKCTKANIWSEPWENVIGSFFCLFLIENVGMGSHQQKNKHDHFDMWYLYCRKCHWSAIFEQVSCQSTCRPINILLYVDSLLLYPTFSMSFKEGQSIKLKFELFTLYHSANKAGQIKVSLKLLTLTSQGQTVLPGQIR